MSDHENARCPWCGTDPEYVIYHDQVWGRPVADSQQLFEKLCLDGQQAGLSWITILRKQANYQRAFDRFNPELIARYSEADVERLLLDPGIVRNRLKINSIIRNARSYLAMAEAGEDFALFLWSFVGGRPVVNTLNSMKDIPVSSPAAEQMSRALKNRGFNFVGPTICYAFMQAVGMVNDHLVGCPVREEVVLEGQRFSLPSQ